MSTKAKNVSATTATKLPPLKALRQLAKEAGVPGSAVNALIPQGTKPTNMAKQTLLKLIEQSGAKAPQAPKAKATTRRKPKTTKTRAVTESSKTPGKATEKGQATERRVADLNPNKINREIFSASLSDKGIEALVEDIRRRGQRVPIEIMADGTILDGERRWRALTALGYEHADVVVRDATAHDSEDYILDSHSTQRTTSVQEKVNLFNLALKVVRRRHGRPAGRPSKPAQICAGFWEPKRIKTKAAQRAGFQSVRIAEYATRIFRDGDDATKAEVNAGGLAISTAYERVTKPKPAVDPAPTPLTKAKPTSDSKATSDDAEAGQQRASPGGATTSPPEAVEAVEAVASGEPATPEATTPSTPIVDEEFTHPSPEKREQHAVDVTSGGEGEPLVDAGVEPDLDVSDDSEADFASAWAIVKGGVSDRDHATDLVRELTSSIDLECWVSGGEAEDTVAELARLLEHAVDNFAAADPERAHDWFQGFAQNISESIDGYRTQDEAGGYDD
jgi:hypothetical protein